LQLSVAIHLIAPEFVVPIHNICSDECVPTIIASRHNGNLSEFQRDQIIMPRE